MKRLAEEPLEEISRDDSPAQKRVRTDIASAVNSATTSVIASEQNIDEDAELKTKYINGEAGQNGNAMKLRPGERDKIDLLGADSALHEELEEASATPQAMTGDDEIEDEDDIPVIPKRRKGPEEGFEDLYLDTIDRTRLDFDFEKLCSVTLSNINIYACLVCGKYFQGRGDKSQAYFHAVNTAHHPFINMQTKKIYILPEGYEVINTLFDDIKYVVDPHYTKQDIAKLDTAEKESFDVWNKKYIPGFVGLNNIKANSYLNVVVHALAHVKPIRNFFLLEDLSKRSRLVQDFSVLIRKIWNPRAFKGHVSPHELLQSVSQQSNKRFLLTEQADPAEFLMWLLLNMHTALGGKPNVNGSSIIHRIFQGNLHSESQIITARANAGDRLIFEDAPSESKNQKFLILPLDLPPKPLFVDDPDDDAIPSVDIEEVLEKYDGLHAQEKAKMRIRYRLIHPLPPYIIFTVKRFAKGKFTEEYNPTLLTWNESNTIDMNPYAIPDPNKHNPSEPIMYDLVANVVHEAVKVRDDSVSGESQKKVWKVQLKDKARGMWFEVEDLYVRQIQQETLFTAESYIMIWERKTAPKNVAQKKVYMKATVSDDMETD